MNRPARAAVMLVAVSIIALVVCVTTLVPPPAVNPGQIYFEILITLLVSQARAALYARRLKHEHFHELRDRPATVAGSQISHRLED
jgi:hypothetical protein